MQTIEQQTSKGQTVKYNVYEYLNQIIVDVRLDGKNVASGTPEAVNEEIQGTMVYGQVGRVKISREDVWNDVLAAYTEAKEALESSDEYKAKQLREERERLVRELGYAQDELRYHERELVERAGMGESHQYDEQALERQITEAQTALEDFDAEHPEIIEQLNQEKERSLERNRWM